MAWIQNNALVIGDLLPEGDLDIEVAVYFYHNGKRIHTIWYRTEITPFKPDKEGIYRL